MGTPRADLTAVDLGAGGDGFSKSGPMPEEAVSAVDEGARAVCATPDLRTSCLPAEVAGECARAAVEPRAVEVDGAGQAGDAFADVSSDQWWASGPDATGGSVGVADRESDVSPVRRPSCEPGGAADAGVRAGTAS